MARNARCKQALHKLFTIPCPWSAEASSSAAHSGVFSARCCCVLNTTSHTRCSFYRIDERSCCITESAFFPAEASRAVNNMQIGMSHAFSLENKR